MAAEIGRALGGSSTGGQWLARCPAHDDQRPSLSITDGAHGALFNCLAGCDFRDVRDALRGMGLWPEFEPGENREPLLPPRPIKVAPSRSELCKLATAQEIYNQAFPCLQSTPCERYLRRRGIWEPAKLTPMRYARLMHPQTGEKNVPCLVVPRHDVRTGTVVACHRIFLTEDGQKYPANAKMSLGTSASAWAMLHQATGELVLAEGPENALSANILFERPAWAKCGPFPKEIDLANDIRDTLIVADCDPNGGSERKAKVLAAFIISTGRRCEVVVAGEVGADANDVLMGAA